MRVILELGSGNDLHGSDYTKAAVRAVADALHHSSLAFIRSLKIDKTKLDVEVTIGVQRPDLVQIEEIKALLPVGNPTVKAIKGGLDVSDPEHDDATVIASGHRRARRCFSASQQRQTPRAGLSIKEKRNQCVTHSFASSS